MKRITIIFTVMIFASLLCQGQSTSMPIVMKKSFGGYTFFQGDKRLNMNQLVNAMESNNQAYTQIKSAKSTYTIASTLGLAGGFLVGWPLGTAIGGGKPNWVLAGIGAGLIVASIPISNNFNKKARKAVDTYNGELKTSSFWDRKELDLSMTGGGIGLTLRF